MKRLTMTLAALSLAGPAAAQDAARPEVLASGTAEATVQANLAVLTVRFSRRGDTPLEAGRNLAAKADSLRRALRGLGIPRDSVINSSQWYWWNQRVQQVVTERRFPRLGAYNSQLGPDSIAHDTAYQASESLQVRIRDMSSVGAVIDSALAQGLHDISDVTFSATSTEREQQDALRRATRLARRRAEAMASAGGVRLGRTVQLSTVAAAPPVTYRNFLSLDGIVASGAEEPSGATVVVSPVLRVTASVYGRWELAEASPVPAGDR